MRIAMVLGGWFIGSVALGLLLGWLFGIFAVRRQAEEQLFAWLEKLRILAALGGSVAERSKAFYQILRRTDSGLLRKLDDEDCLKLEAQQPGGMLQ